jgi:hypothetical protein
MVKVIIPRKYSPLTLGKCCLDDRVIEWLDRNIKKFRITCEEHYSGPVHMASGADPHKTYTVYFSNEDEAILFKLTWF